MSHTLKIVSAALAIAIASLPVHAAGAEPNDLNGRWILADGAGVLVIKGASWFHPKHGTGTIKRGRGAADYEVFYTEHQGTRCAYQINTAAGGELLVLDTADATQSPDFCPAGKLSRVSN